MNRRSRKTPMKIILRFFIIYTLILAILVCKPKKKEALDSETISFILAQRTGVEGTCQKFLLTEAGCISSPDNALAVCPALVTTLKSRITPADKATDAVAELYFSCFAETNVIYNQAISCTKTSFNTTGDYRRAQRGTASGSSQNAVAAWKVQFNNCASIENGVPPANSGLRETQTKLTSDPFQ